MVHCVYMCTQKLMYGQLNWRLLKRITVTKFGVNDGGGNGTGGCEIKAIIAVLKEMRSGLKRQAVYQR